MKYLNLRGNEYHQFFQFMPAVEPMYTDFEKNFDPLPGVNFSKTNSWMPVACVVLYLVSIVGGQKLMESRKPIKMDGVLSAWNLALSLFSLCGALRTVPHILHNVFSKHFDETICTPAELDWGCGACGFWVQLFVFSKIPELFDTFFLVTRKKPVLFLHWYHHCSVLLYCWHSYSTEAAQALYFVAMNYSVHALMYFYFFLSAAKIKHPIPPMSITMCQLAQMVVGVGVQVASYRKYLDADLNCDVKLQNVVSGFVMYGSYFLLFFLFFLDVS